MNNTAVDERINALISLIDEAPTLASILGQTMSQAQGRVLQELLL